MRSGMASKTELPMSRLRNKRLEYAARGDPAGVMTLHKKEEPICTAVVMGQTVVHSMCLEQDAYFRTTRTKTRNQV